MDGQEDNSPPEFSDDERTLIYGAADDNRVSPEELRQGLDLPAGDRIQDYGELSTIGVGGVGAVFSAYEPGLNREVALKLLRPQFRNQSDRIADFIREARATAQIDHPNIVPVHRLGVFEDVGVYFTMKKVEGETLRAILKKLEADRPGYRRKYTLRRLLEIFLGACNGVAFAHRHGILHCDLKPGNLMVGDYGEVLVMDWGMARYRPELDQGRSGNKMNLELECELRPGTPTDGNVPGGTPAFMAPELLTGEETTPNEQSDVYGLGTILYTILTWRGAPFDVTKPVEDVMRDAALGRFVPPRKAAPKAQPLPLELEAICRKAMARNRSQRYAKVDELLHDVRNYLDGYPVGAYSPTLWYRFGKLLRRRPLVPSVLAAALLTWLGFFGYNFLTNLSQSNSLLNQAEYNYGQGRDYNSMVRRTYRQLRSTPANNGEALQENYLERELLRELAEMENGYNSALEFISRAPEYGVRSEVTDRMVRDIFKSSLSLYSMLQDDNALNKVVRQARGRWRDLFERAVEQDPELALLVAEIDASVGTLAIDGDAGQYLLTIRDPAGNIISLPGTDENSAATAENLPLFAGENLFTLPAGDYDLLFQRADSSIRTPVEVPIGVKRTVMMQTPPEIPAGMVFVPGGEFFHERSAGRLGLSRNHVNAFLIGRYEVTFGEYLAFWKTLSSRADREAFRAYAVLPGGSSALPVPLWSEEGVLIPPYQESSPVIGITAAAAEAYAAWFGRGHGLVGRLPQQLEWEKAARGVDGRLYPWGDNYLLGAALLADNRGATARYPVGAAPGTFPKDCSPYGLYDMAGNVREFLRDPGDAGRMSAVAGGSFLTGARQAGCAAVNYVTGADRDIGFRCLLELPEKNDNPKQ